MSPVNRALRPLFPLLLLTFSLATPAWARLIIGVTPTATPGAGDRRTLNECAELLGNQLGEAVYLRSIDNEALLIDWVARFRELDAALITTKAFAASSAGDLVKVTNLAVDGGQSLTVVTYAGQSSTRIVRLRALSQLPNSEPGRKLLQHSRPSMPATSSQAINGSTLLTPTTPPQASMVPASTPTQVASSPLPPKDRATTQPEPELPRISTARQTTPVQKIPSVKQTQLVSPFKAPPAAVPIPTVDPAIQPETPTAVTTHSKASAPSPPIQPATVTPAAVPQAQTKLSRPRFTFFVSLILITGIFLKLALLLRHWRRNRAVRVSTPPPVASTPIVSQKPAAQTTTPDSAKISAGLRSASSENILPDLPSTWESAILPPILQPLSKDQGPSLVDSDPNHKN